MAHRSNDTSRHLLQCLIEMSVDAGHHVVEARQHIVGIIQLTVRQDVAFRAFENGETAHAGIQLVNLRLLLADAFRSEPVGHLEGLGMIRDSKILQS